MGGRGSGSGFGKSGSGSRGFPKLSGSEKQVQWAESIRSDAMAAIENGLRNAKEEYSKFKDFTSEAEMHLYDGLKESMSAQFQQVTEASKIIDVRNSLSPNNIHSMVKNKAKDMNLQHKNGWKYDAKLKRMVRPD